MTSEIYKEGKAKISITDAQEIEGLFGEARKNTQKGMEVTFHRSQREILRINLILPERYIRPYKYSHPSQVEFLLPRTGIAELLIFSQDGKIDQTRLLTQEAFLVEVEANTWRMILARTPFTAFELINHPLSFQEGEDKIYAPWAPAEGTKEADIYLENLRQKLGLSEAS